MTRSPAPSCSTSQIPLAAAPRSRSRRSRCRRAGASTLIRGNRHNPASLPCLAFHLQLVRQPRRNRLLLPVAADNQRRRPARRSLPQHPPQLLLAFDRLCRSSAESRRAHAAQPCPPARHGPPGSPLLHAPPSASARQPRSSATSRISHPKISLRLRMRSRRPTSPRYVPHRAPSPSRSNSSTSDRTGSQASHHHRQPHHRPHSIRLNCLILSIAAAY